MGIVRFVDTCIFLNLLKVPGKSQDYEQIYSQLLDAITNKDSFVIPISTMIETGNHVSHISDGNLRREIASEFTRYLQCARDFKDGWSINTSISQEELDEVMSGFTSKVVEKIGIGDMCIVEQYKKFCEGQQPFGKAIIWSIDIHMQGYSCDGDLSRRKYR